MALQIRRGTNLQRQQIIPLEGELIYVTDYDTQGVSPMFIGDGSSTGGIALSSSQLKSLSDVTISGELNNQILQYNSSSSHWTNNSNVQIPGTLTIDGDTTIANNKKIQGTMASNDYWKITGIGPTVDIGSLEIATGDNGNEPIYVRQYVNSTVAHQVTLMDASGNTQVNSLDITGFAKLAVLTSAPTSPLSGMVAIANGTTWNPTGTGKQTMVVYLGGGWRQLNANY